MRIPALFVLAESCLSFGEPVIETITLSPSPVTDTGPLTVSVTASDPEGDPVSLTYRWWVGEVLQAEAGPTLDDALFARGDVVRVEVTPRDPYVEGLPASIEATVQDAPPGPPVAAVEPADAIWGRDRLSCVLVSPSVDPDGDPVTYTVSWTADGAPFAGADADGTIRGVDTTLAREWGCQLTPSDGIIEGPAAGAVLSPAAALSNVLVLLIDDIGNDRPAFTGQHPVPSVTPTLDRLADEGVYFPNMYVSPLCSPSRAMAFTGRYGRRTGVGYIVDHWLWQVDLAPTEVTAPEVLRQSATPYATSFVGKYHMSSAISGPSAPLSQGVDWYAGTLGNVLDPPGVGYSWFEWEKDDNGTLAVADGYLTTDSADDAIDRMNSMPEPWMLWVSFNAIHTPLHRPPSSLTPVTMPDNQATDFEKHTAVLEALDTEIDRMLRGIPSDVRDRTTIVLFGDNGTDKQGTLSPWDPEMAKETVYEAGVNVPLVLWGPLVQSPGTTVDALVHAVDILPTVAAIGGVDVRDLRTVDDAGSPAPVRLDGHNLLPFLAEPDAPPVRDYVFSETFSQEIPGSEGRRDRDDTWHANGRPPYAFVEQMVRDARYKLVHKVEGALERYELYDLDGLDVEGDDLLAAGPLTPEQQGAYDHLYDLLQAEMADQQYDVPNQPVYLADARIDPPLAEPGEDLTCVVGRIIDGDDDPVQMSYRWTEGGAPLGETSAVLPAAAFAHGSDVRCIAAGTDESGVPTEIEAAATFGP